jgi:hypothetical protein
MLRAYEIKSDFLIQELKTNHYKFLPIQSSGIVLLDMKDILVKIERGEQ